MKALPTHTPFTWSFKRNELIMTIMLSCSSTRWDKQSKLKKNVSQLLKGQPRKMQTSQNDPSVTVGTGTAAVHLATEKAFVYPAPGKVPSDLRIARQFNSGVSGTGTWTRDWGGSRTRTGQKRLLSIQLRGKVTVPRAPENAAVSNKPPWKHFKLLSFSYRWSFKNLYSLKRTTIKYLDWTFYHCA